jgi:hypothetical protein
VNDTPSVQSLNNTVVIALDPAPAPKPRSEKPRMTREPRRAQRLEQLPRVGGADDRNRTTFPADRTGGQATQRKCLSVLVVERQVQLLFRRGKT